jgi:hypothetical protein
MKKIKLQRKMQSFFKTKLMSLKINCQRCVLGSVFCITGFSWYFDINCFIISLYSSFSRILLLSLKYLDRLYEYFKELNSSENEASPDDFSRIYSQNGVDLLNSEITEDEVIKAIKNLKNNISTASRIDYFFISI